MSTEPVPGDAASPSVDVNETVSPTAANAAVDPSAAATDLPQVEELTPEILEDECLRGDAMLRWAALLLAVLLSWTYLTDASVLVDIRAGEFMFSHGVLPPRVDPFSASAEGRTWVNLGWLSNLTLGLANQAGLWAVTLVGVVCTLVGFYALSQISVPRVTTWWGSINLVLAVLAVFPILQPGRGAITVLGLGCLLWTLHQARHRGIAGLTWKVALLMLLWSNADPNAYLGLLMLLAWTIGEVLQPAAISTATSSSAPQSVANPWFVLASGLGAAVVHPWHVHVLLAPYVALFVTGPERRIYAEGGEMGLNWLVYGPLHAEFWLLQDVFTTIGLVLLGLAVLCLALNYRRLDFGLTLGWLLINLLGVMSGELFACAAIFNAVVATVNGQNWFKHTFSQDYKIERWSVLKSQAGRAVTVLAMLGVAYVSINGMLMGPGGRRIGMGLDPRWRHRIQGLEQLLPGIVNNRVFPLRLAQGDLLIWLKQQPFVDSRLALYSQGDENLLVKHRETRVAFRKAREEELGSGKPEVWQQALQEHETYTVMPRLWGNPDYLTFFDLFETNWRLTGFSGAGAVFVPPLADHPELDDFVQTHTATDFLRDGLREPDPASVVTLPPTWPAPANVYDKWLIQRIPQVNDGTQMAIHYNRLRLRAFQFLDQVMARAVDPAEPRREEFVTVAVNTFPQTLSLCYLTIRHARRGLSENLDQGGGLESQAGAYRVLRDTYIDLGRLEQILGQTFGGIDTPGNLRTMQALAAAHDAVRASGEPADRFQLFQLQLQLRQVDLALASLEKYQELTGQLSPAQLTGDAAIEEQANNEATLEEMRTHVTSVRDALQLQAEEAATPQQLFGFALQSYCPGIALEVLERDRTVLADNLDLNLYYAESLLNVGRTEEAWESLEAIDRRFPDARVQLPDLPQFQRWCLLTASANLAALDLKRADELLTRSSEGQSRLLIRSLLSAPTLSYGRLEESEMAPAVAGKMTFDMYQRNQIANQNQLDIARLRWEAGDIAGTQLALERILTHDPETVLRPLVAWMLDVITQQPHDPIPPSERIPVTDELFAPDSAPESEPESEVVPATVPQEAPTQEAPTQEAPAQEAPAQEVPTQEATGN